MSEIRERLPINTLRRHCPTAETYQDATDAECGLLDCGGHRLRLRRMIICSECEQGYFTKADFEGHECYSAY